MTMRLPSGGSTRSVDSALYDALDTYVEQQMRRLRIPGASLAVVEGDQIVHLRGFGAAHRYGTAPTPQTPFVLGSTTKSFTALAVMQLVEAGKIDLDAPIQRYLAWFRLHDPNVSAQITVRHLLNQTSGLPGVPGTTLLADLDESSSAAERQMRAISTLKLKRAPGDAFEYSNLNYILLGLIIEAVSGKTYADYIRRSIFVPLRMRHSYTLPSAARRHGLATGHRYWFGVPFSAPKLPIPRGALAAGELISSAEDMAHYLIAHINGGRYDDAQILSPESVDEMHRGVAECRALGETVGWYGMGWFSTHINQTNIVWHSGNVPDFSSFMALLPAQKRGVVLLINADHYGLPMILAEVGLRAAAVLAGQEPPPIQLGLLPWMMRALPSLPILQIAGVVATLRLLRRWRQSPALYSKGDRTWARYVLPSLAANLPIAALPIFLWARGLLRFLLLFTPDAAWIALISGSFAGVWAFLRTGLIVRALRDMKDAGT